MILKYPKLNDLPFWNDRKFPGIMHNATHSSPYFLIGLAQSGTDVYVAFTNHDQDNVWIEKTTQLMGLQGMYAKSFQQIETDEEFNLAHSFFVKEGILDGPKRT